MRIRTLFAAALVTVTAAAAMPGSSNPRLGPADDPAAGVAASTPSTPDGVDRALARLDREQRRVKKELRAVRRKSSMVHRRAILRGRAYVRVARAGLLPIGGGFDALIEHASRLERLRRALARDIDLEHKLDERSVALGKRLDAIAERRIPLEADQRAMAQARTALLAARDRALAFKRAFQSSGPGAPTAIYGAAVGPSDPAGVSGGFASMKGRLPFPVPGRTEIHTAARRAADGPGLEMRAPLGSPVRAVYPGRVAFADVYADYGKTVIVDEGDGYYTVSANLAEINVEVGDDVSQGTRLGTVGDSGKGPALYFEIRKGADTLDPSGWFGI